MANNISFSFIRIFKENRECTYDYVNLLHLQGRFISHEYAAYNGSHSAAPSLITDYERILYT